MTQGEILEANVKTALAYLSPSPNHFEPIEAMDIAIKFAPDSVATAFASIVLPVPGGPNKRMPWTLN
jgi:hypothetical protein